MAFLVFAIAMLAVISREACLVYGDIGTATSYNPPYLPTKCDGYREDQFPPGNLFVAVSEGLWDNGAACGRRYRLRCLSGPNKPCKRSIIDVKVVDFCPITPCPATMVLSNDAFSAIARYRGQKVNIEYIQLRFDGDPARASACVNSVIHGNRAVSVCGAKKLY